MRTLALAFGLAAVPVMTLAVMVGTGWAAPLPAFIAIVLTLLAALVVALSWNRDLDLITGAVRRVAADGTGAASYARPAPPSLGQLRRELERLSRRVASRTALVDQLQRADVAIVERLPDPLLVLGADRAVRRANAAARAAFGSDIGAVLRHPGLHGAIDRAFASGDVQSAELILPVPVQREVQATVVPMDPPLADGGRMVVVLSDRTRERASERMRADFVANASHELRTPLASLIGFVETLRGPAADDPPAQQRFLAIMAEQGARMNRLIDDLLSLSRIELTEHQAPSESVDLVTLLPRLVAGYEPRLAEHAARLEVQIAAGLPPVPADADQLAQVLQNLAGQRGEIRPRGRHGAPVGAARAGRRQMAGPARGRARYCGPGRGNRPRTPAAADRAILSGGQGTFPRGGRHRVGPRHRQAHRQSPPRPVVDRKRGRRRHHRQRLAPGQSLPSCGRDRGA